MDLIYSAHMVFRLRILLVFTVLLFQLNTAVGQIDLNDFSLVLIGNNTSMKKISNSQMNQFFRGKYYRWPNNKNVVIVLPSSKHQKVELYSNAIYDKSFYSVKKYWFSLVFQGRFDPPHFFDSDREIIDFVRKTQGSFAVVRENELIPDELRMAIVD